MPNYFVFENVNGKWLLLESDFARKIVPSYVFSIFKNIGKGLGFLFLLSIPFWVFWIWMLIDCVKRPIEDKAIWILIIVFLQFLGAILYFFIPRKKHKKIQKVDNKNINLK